MLHKDRPCVKGGPLLIKELFSHKEKQRDLFSFLIASLAIVSGLALWSVNITLFLVFGALLGLAIFLDWLLFKGR